MARSGVYKSEVQKARDVLLAQGKHPSIDAVRAELGNTGSKTTIHRYLKELEGEEGAGAGRSIAVSEALQDLVDRLAARLHEEAEERVARVNAEHAKQAALHEDAMARQQSEVTGLLSRLQQAETALTQEQTTHAETRQVLQTLSIQRAQLEQQVADLQVRLKDNELHRQSLEDKHQHARGALEHYRESVKEQREQEQRKYEQQTQHLQVENRSLNQTLILKQGELTQAYQDAARSGAELIAIRKELRRSEADREKEGQNQEKLQQRVAQLEGVVDGLTSQLQQAGVRHNAAWLRLQELTEQLLAQQAAVAQPLEEEIVPGGDLFSFNDNP